ncbi:MAG: thioredoxin domain-containing protein [Deinococcota bacterium]
MPNRLQTSSSPYLRQHADNPVDWYPWGDEAFDKAKAENKPVLLSVGYASCHWCHVMAHESFEDTATAEIMNREFVNIKVDREERPDIDAIYMEALQMMTGGGGWPMTVVMTPNGKPFFAGTYFPKEDKYQYPAFTRVLLGLVDAWQTRQAEISQVSENITDNLGNIMQLSSEGDLSHDLVDAAISSLQATFDSTYGGFGDAPKFPPHSILRLLLQTSEDDALQMATTTLDKMAAGGIYDQLGGGFARYSVDAIWLVPHFEKMLYDNAQLVPCYLEAYLRTGKPRYKQVANETLGWVARELTDATTGGFYSALDADSEGEEGKFYAWTAHELDAVLAEDSPFAKTYFGVGEVGNFEGKSVLHRHREDDEVAAFLGLSVGDVQQKCASITHKLLAIRDTRIRPGLDDKVLTSLNGLMLAAYADAGRILGRQEYLDIALKNARFIRDTLMRTSTNGNTRLWHLYDPHSQHVSIEGLLEDYSYVGLGFLALYRATLEPATLELCFKLADSILEHFYDDPEQGGTGGFFTTADDAEKLIVRPKSYFDSAMPSGNGSAAMLLLAVARYQGDAELEAKVRASVTLLSELMQTHPQGFGTLLAVTKALNTAPKDVVIITPTESKDGPELERMLELLQQSLLPNTSILLASVHEASQDDALPALRGRTCLDGKVTAYVCENGTCKLPVSSAKDFAEQLQSLLVT